MGAQPLYAGVDIGGTKILASVIDANGKVLSRAKVKTRAQEGVEPVVKRVEQALREAADGAEVKLTQLTATGVGFAGPVQFDKGVALTAGNMPWKNVPLRDMLAKRMGLKNVVIENDVNAGTYGEWVSGAGKGCKSLLGVFVGTGIGGGLVLDGRMYRGHFFTAGEIGHTVIQAGGNLTGRTLEDLASRAALGIFIARRIATNHPSAISKLVDPEKLFTRARSGLLKQAYADGDPVVRQIVHESARYTGVAAANAVTLLSLQRVVVGGGVVEALGKEYVNLVEKHLRQDIFPETLPVEVVPAKLEDDAVIVGAALLARDTAGGK